MPGIYTKNSRSVPQDIRCYKFHEVRIPVCEMSFAGRLIKIPGLRESLESAEKNFISEYINKDSCWYKISTSGSIRDAHEENL